MPSLPTESSHVTVGLEPRAVSLQMPGSSGPAGALQCCGQVGGLADGGWTGLEQEEAAGS